MKKLLLCAIFALSALAGGAEVNRLVFHTLDGNVQAVGLTELNITFADGEMIATSKGESVRINVASLEFMEFADDGTGAIDAASAAERFAGAVTVYTADGQLHGRFQSVTEACSALPGGIYLFKTECGTTSKIMITR